MSKQFSWGDFQDRLDGVFDRLHEDDDVPLHPSVAQQTRTSTACPEQWEGRLEDGRYFYFRYRSGTAGLGLSEVSVDDAVEYDHRCSMKYGHPLDGIFSDVTERQKVFAMLLARYESGDIGAQDGDNK